MEVLWKYACIISFMHIQICLTLQANQYGVCNRTNSDGVNWLSCCTNYQHNTADDTCIVCPNGTFGENCIENCPYNNYGLRCQYKCQCKLEERCDRVVGCTNPTGDRGKYWLKVGVPSGIIFITVIMFSSVLIRLLKTRRRGNNHVPFNERQNTSYTPATKSIYDEIDDAMLVGVQTLAAENVIENVQTIKSTYSNSSEPTELGDDDTSEGYLNPYTPLAENWQNNTHVYNDDNCIEDIVQGRYLNPYQPLTHEWQSHAHVYDHRVNVMTQKDAENKQDATSEHEKDVDVNPGH